MPQSLSPQELAFLRQILPHVGPERRVRFMTLRRAGVPEETARIFNSDTEYLDSLVNRRLKILRKKGWIDLDHSMITVLENP